MSYWILGSVQVKKTLLHLDMLKNMFQIQKRIGRPLNEAIDSMIKFEKEIAEIQENNEIIKRFSYRFQNPYYEYLPDYYGGEVLALGDMGGSPKPITELSEDPTFDPNRIDEIIRLFDALRKLSICGVAISGEERFEEILGFCQDPKASTTLDFSIKHENSLINCQPQQVHKIFSDAELDYKLNPLKETSKTLFRNKQYRCKLITPPSWVISGQVIYNRDASINLGMSSPHTQFDFTASSLYIDPLGFPTREELYSPNETKSLSLKLLKERK